jgi:hypothetical protein
VRIRIFEVFRFGTAMNVYPDEKTPTANTPDQRVRPNSMILSFRHPKGQSWTCQLDEPPGFPLV